MIGLWREHQDWEKHNAPKEERKRLKGSLKKYTWKKIGVIEQNKKG